MNSNKEVYGVAINNGSVPNINKFGTYGGDNNHSDLDAFMLGTKMPIEGSSVFVAPQNTFPFNTEVKNVYASDCKWAIGGHTLKLTSTFSNSTAFFNSMSAGAHNYGVNVDQLIYNDPFFSATLVGERAGSGGQ